MSLTVSDGREQSTGLLTVAVKAPGDVPLIAEPFVALATAGEEISIDPLRHVRGGSGQIRLSAVPAKPDVQLTPDFDGGTFRFTSSDVRTHYLEYSVTDGTDTATGLVRVDVSAPPDRDTTPITVPHTTFLRLQQPVDVDVLATDIDPTGGVLIVTGVTDPADDEGVKVEVIDHRVLRVTLIRPLANGSTTFGYRVSNGLAEAEGVVTVVEVPQPESYQPPVAAPDTISARTGDVVEIGVLDNDEHPDALPLTLAPDLIADPADGLLFVAGDRLRYFAPDQAGEFEATYRVDASDGQFATATVHISVREADPVTNSAPVPRAVTARVIAGETVRIPIPLGGTDPDGDSVQLLGQDTNPERGAVVARGGDWLDYEAGEYSAGTDTFQYSVVDALGARSTGSIRVGIAPGLDGARAPIAAPDVVTVRPGRTISVRVLENDSDPDGGGLELRSVKQTLPGATAAIEGDTIQVEVPDGDGDYGFLLRGRERGARRGIELPHRARARRRAVRASRGLRHRADAQRHPRRGGHRRRGAPQRVPGRRERRRPPREPRRRIRGRGPGASGRQHPRDGGGPPPDHPVRGQPPRGPGCLGVRLHLGARPRRRAAAAASRRARRGGARAARRSCSTSRTT